MPDSRVCGRAIELGVTETVVRLRSPEIWLSPLTAPELPSRTDPAHPLGVPEWVARLGGSVREGSALGRLDEMTNRIWVAISAATRPLDPVLEEFGFRPERRRLGGGSFGVSARTLPQLDPSGAIGQRWKRYRAAYERLRRGGVVFTRPPEREDWGGQVATFADPDGNVLQLMQLPA